MDAEITPADRRRLALATDTSEPYLYQCLTGRRDMGAMQAMKMELATDGELRRWALCSRTWHLIWPDLIGTAGAPPIPTTKAEPARA